MNYILLSVFVIIPISTCLTQENGSIFNIAKVQFPPYEDVDDIKDYYSKDVYETAISNSELDIEKITYFSDGLKVTGFLAKPATIRYEKYPVIIFNRGSYIRNNIAYVHAPLFEKFVKHGFIVFAPAIRQSEGGEGKDEVGGKDLDDILNTLPLLSSLSYADTARLYMYGESRGGIMTLLSIRAGFPLKAAAIVGAITDFELFINKNPGMDAFCQQLWPDYKVNKEQIFINRSALFWPEKINTPLLIMNGGSDPQVSPLHSLHLAEKLQSLGKIYQLMILEGGNHRLSLKYAEERDRQILDWFKKH